MVQTLKRVYLYTAATFALLFTASITIILLNTLLNQAGMLPYYVDYDGTVNTEGIAPNSQQVTQVVILFIITVVLVGLLFGGGHYWLIRRDAHSDPNADGGVVRHLFLNALLALAALVGVPTTLAFLGGIDETEGSHDPALGLSFALVSDWSFCTSIWNADALTPSGARLRSFARFRKMLCRAFCSSSPVVLSSAALPRSFTPRWSMPMQCHPPSVSSSQVVARHLSPARRCRCFRPS